MSHRRRSTGLWLRGTVYQYRVRVLVELRQRLGRSHLNRSLRTSSYAEAIRMARQSRSRSRACSTRHVRASEATQSTPCATGPARSHRPLRGRRHRPTRHRPGDPHRSGPARQPHRRKAPSGPAGSAVSPTLSVEPVTRKTIQEVYDAYMTDPGVIRSGKTILAYGTVFNLLIEIMGKETPISDISRETCREVMEHFAACHQTRPSGTRTSPPVKSLRRPATLERRPASTQRR